MATHRRPFSSAGASLAPFRRGSLEAPGHGGKEETSNKKRDSKDFPLVPVFLCLSRSVTLLYYPLSRSVLLSRPVSLSLYHLRFTVCLAGTSTRKKKKQPKKARENIRETHSDGDSQLLMQPGTAYRFMS